MASACCSLCSNFSHTEVLRSRSFSATHFSTVFLETARFFDGGPDELGRQTSECSSRSLVCPDIATAQTKLCPYTIKLAIHNVQGSSSLRVHPACTPTRTGWGTRRWSLENMHVAVCRACLRGVPSSVIIAAGSFKLRPLLLVCST